MKLTVNAVSIMHAVLWLSLHTETETEQQLSVGTVHLALDLCLQIVPK